MNVLKQYIKEQIEFNSGKNLFSDPEISELDFSVSTRKLIAHWQELHEAEEGELIEFTVREVLDQLCRTNQYYNFSKEAEDELFTIYKALLFAIKQYSAGNNLEHIAHQHYVNLKTWLHKTNSFAQYLYPAQEPFIQKKVVCEEYSAQMQLELLHISLNQLAEPILDVGCGKTANLINYLRSMGLEAFGLDRNLVSTSCLIRGSWLDFEFKPDSWGTIISHLGFSNHFQHHHLRKGESFILYAQKYMEILRSLKPKGRFYYAPDLPFIETYLESGQYLIERYAIKEMNINAISVERLK